MRTPLFSCRLAVLFILSPGGCRHAPAATPPRAALAPPVAAPGASAPSPSTVTITFLATSDIHGFIETDHAEITLDGKKVAVARGGLPLVAGYVNIARRKNPGRVVLLDGGDMLQGTLVSNLGEGRAAIRAMNAVGYTAAALGNHEFDFGPVGPRSVPKGPGDDPRGALAERIREARFPVLSANVVDEPGGAAGATRIESLVRPFIITEAGGVRVGIVGGTSEDTPRTTNAKNLSDVRVLPLAPSVAKAAAAARAAGATVVVAVVHEGGECARFDDPDDLSACHADAELFKLARALPPGAVDAIFGGHTHQGVAHRVAGIPILQPFAHARALSRLDLVVDRATGRPLPGPAGSRIYPPTGVCAATADGSCDERRARGTALRPATWEGEPVVADATVAAAFAGDVAAAADKRRAPVGVTLAAPIRARYREESALGNLAADALRRAGKADFGLMNGGGLRGDLPAGPLSFGALFEAFPFDNRLAVLAIPGAALRQLAARNLGGDHGILSFSGLTARGTCAGETLAVDLVLDGGAPLDDRRVYTLATNDFLAAGGDDFASVTAAALVKAPIIDESGATIRELVAAELALHGPRVDGEKPFFDPAHGRVMLPAPRPFPCREAGKPRAPNHAGH